jgi:hypothetical protein
MQLLFIRTLVKWSVSVYKRGSWGHAVIVLSAQNSMVLISRRNVRPINAGNIAGNIQNLKSFYLKKQIIGKVIRGTPSPPNTGGRQA